MSVCLCDFSLNNFSLNISVNIFAICELVHTNGTLIVLKRYFAIFPQWVVLVCAKILKINLQCPSGERNAKGPTES